MSRTRLTGRKEADKCRRWLRGKSGDEMVEAAVVLPILILMILSLLLVMTFFFRDAAGSFSLQEKMTEKAAGAKRIFRTLSDREETLGEVRGLFQGRLSRTDSVTVYCMNEAMIVRLGEEYFEKDTG